MIDFQLDKFVDEHVYKFTFDRENKYISANSHNKFSEKTQILLLKNLVEQEFAPSYFLSISSKILRFHCDNDYVFSKIVICARKKFFSREIIKIACNLYDDIGSGKENSFVMNFIRKTLIRIFCPENSLCFYDLVSLYSLENDTNKNYIKEIEQTIFDRIRNSCKENRVFQESDGNSSYHYLQFILYAGRCDESKCEEIERKTRTLTLFTAFVFIGIIALVLSLVSKTKKTKMLGIDIEMIMRNIFSLLFYEVNRRINKEMKGEENNDELNCFDLISGVLDSEEIRSMFFMKIIKHLDSFRMVPLVLAKEKNG